MEILLYAFIFFGCVMFFKGLMQILNAIGIN